MYRKVEREIAEADEGDEAAVLQALDDYQTAFSGHDPQRTQLCYHKPCIVFDAEGVRV